MAIYDSPVLLEPVLSQSEGLYSRCQKARHYGVDIAWWIVGPMPLSSFNETFLCGTSTDPSYEQKSMLAAFSKVPFGAKRCDEISRPMLAALNQKRSKSLFPGFVFDNVALPNVHPDEQGPMKSSRKLVHDSDGAFSSKSNYTDLFIDISPDSTHDFFHDPPARSKVRNRLEFLSHSDSKRKQMSTEELFGQHVSYVSEIFARQQRVFLFTIVMYGSLTRILRWDRSGCVVSEAFDVADDAAGLCNFLLRFSSASDAGRGHDTSVAQATSTDETLFANAIREYVRSQITDSEDLEQAVQQRYSPRHVYATHILRRLSPLCEENTRKRLFSRPAANSSSVTGRGTRGYWALDVSSGKIVFLKDTWRDSLLAEVEGDILQQLHEAGVSFVPSFVWHGDVSSLDGYSEERRPLQTEIQSTMTNTLCGEEWVCRVQGSLPRFSQRRHCRLVMGTVGMPMSTVRGTEELLHATHDVFTGKCKSDFVSALRGAADVVRTKESRLHRDVSVGNIVLVKEADSEIRRGYLIDWEMSCKVNDSSEAIEKGDLFAQGTWAFMSMRVLTWYKDDDSWRLKFEDDMESLLYVVMYSALLWQPHHFTAKGVTMIIRGMFDEYTRISYLNVLISGGGKASNVRSRGQVYGKAFKSPAFAKWLSDMMAHHVPKDYDDKAYKGKWDNPVFIYDYWANFLRLHSLERDNRVDNLAGYSKLRDLSTEAVEREQLPPFPDTTSREHSDAEHRRHQLKESAAETQRGKRRGRDLSQSSAPRRSSRIKEKEEARAQAQSAQNGVGHGRGSSSRGRSRGRARGRSR
ncbi:uncharacterized protein BXZ73DRAFT_37757 [Epithele typhae]|uniref:uncharacterized protein n=1 Tax=Epithele typhae TaxID=378194 RepID=UPI0020075B37|nr:uncharacterized protein BXZ73DRAFT_37757 [Epithele typhae]KAH9946414.1 hypothetical protein BXZ73DRAFT_37757 [Epithele typhae]